MRKNPKYRGIDEAELLRNLHDARVFIAAGVSRSQARKRWNEYARCGDDPIKRMLEDRTLVAGALVTVVP